MTTAEPKTALPPSTVTTLATLTDYISDAVISRELVKNDAGTITLFAFGAGQGLSKHSAPFDAFVQVLDGQALVTIDETEHKVEAGEAILMPANIPHAVFAKENFKMMLVLLKGK